MSVRSLVYGSADAMGSRGNWSALPLVHELARGVGVQRWAVRWWHESGVFGRWDGGLVGWWWWWWWWEMGVVVVGLGVT